MIATRYFQIVAALAAVFLLGGCGLPGKGACTPQIDVENARARRQCLDRYRFDDSVRQILFVSHTEGTRAVAVLYEKQARNSAWSPTLEAGAFVGRNGMGKTVEGDGKTPSGDFAVTGAFGILANPGTSLPYTDVRATTFACDEEGAHYNRIVDTALSGHACRGEEMYAFSPEYNYGLTTDYNAANIYPRGSAVFIHCNGLKPFTAGCVSLAEKDMKAVVKAAGKGMRVYLDEYYVSK